MKKKIIIFCSFVVLAFTACHDIPIGYLLADSAQYGIPFEIRKTPDPKLDKMRIQNKADWVGKPIAGVVGTLPINYSVVSITSTDGDAAQLMREIDMRGSGICYIPFEFKSPKGTYLVTVKISNEDHEVIKKDALTIIIN